MARKLLGTLRVYENDDPELDASNTRNLGDDQYEINLMSKEVKKDMGTVLAHELGHFVGALTKQNFYGERNAIEAVANEALANTYATRMYPQANERRMQKWFKTYTDFLAEAKKHRAESVPVGFLQAMGIIR